MAVITLDDVGITRLGGQTYGQQGFDLVDESPITGSALVMPMAPPRWVSSIRSPQAMPLDEAGRWEALVLRLRRGINHLALYDMLRPTTQGGMRYVGTLESALAVGATGAVVLGAIGSNVMLRGSFETDSNADGLADGWSAIQSGSVSSVVYSRLPGLAPSGVYEQGVDWTSGAGGTANYVGLERTVDLPEPASQVTVSAWARTGGSVRCWIRLEFRNLAGTLLASADLVDTTVAGTQRIGGTVATVAGTARVTVRLQAYSTTTGASAVRWDGITVKLGATSLAQDGIARLVAGDWVQLGTGLGTSQLVKVTTGESADDAGRMGFTFEPPLRLALGAGAQVLADKPVGYYKLRNQASTWQAVPNGPAIDGFALDLMEQWQ